MKKTRFPRFDSLPYHKNSTRFIDLLYDLNWPIFLDSGNHDNARYDIISASPYRILVTHGNETLVKDESGERIEREYEPLQLVQEALGDIIKPFSPLPFEGGAIGYLGYDLGRSIKKNLSSIKENTYLPQMMIGIYDWAIIVDHNIKKCWLIGQGKSHETINIWRELLQYFQLSSQKKIKRDNPLYTSSPFISSVSPDYYKEGFDKIQRYIRNGDCYQINFTQQFTANVSGNSWAAYCNMREDNPAPYSAWMKFNDIEILSFSPERFLHLYQGHVITEPIKGTRPRGRNYIEDLHFKKELSLSVKDCAENLMIVDLLRNDLGKVCKPGSIYVPELFRVQSYSTVHHLVSRIVGDLRNNENAFTLLQATFPGGSITGAPKIRAMEIIDEIEPVSRGIYCGVIGYIGYNGNMNTNIVIRTLVKKNRTAHYWVGSGIVADSNVELEYQECLDKASAFREYFSSK